MAVGYSFDSLPVVRISLFDPTDLMDVGILAVAIMPYATASPTDGNGMQAFAAERQVRVVCRVAAEGAESHGEGGRAAGRAQLGFKRWRLLGVMMRR